MTRSLLFTITADSHETIITIPIQEMLHKDSIIQVHYWFKYQIPAISAFDASVLNQEVQLLEYLEFGDSILVDALLSESGVEITRFSRVVQDVNFTNSDVVEKLEASGRYDKIVNQIKYTCVSHLREKIHVKVV